MLAHREHPMRDFRNLFCVIGPRRNPRYKEIETQSVSTQETAAASLQEDGIHFRASEERQLRNDVNAENAEFYQQDLKNADGIRLFRIEPGAGSEPIQGCLEYANMEDDSLPHYDALSYCWGAQHKFLAVTVDGKDGFRVSEHLYAALLRLRRRDEPRLMWIDVVCVNQNNTPERNCSVSLIWKIYSKARRVIVWIGETEPTVPNCPRRWPNTEDGDSRLALCAKPGLAAHEHGSLTKKLSELLRDMEFPGPSGDAGDIWWKRLWVVQEFACAKCPPTVYIGPHSISWEYFSQMMHTKTHDRLHLFQSLRNQDDQSLLRLLFQASDLRCSDPKDRIYALLGLSKDTPSPIVPDYAKSAREVYEEATLYLLREEGNVDVLLDKRQDRTSPDFPSWVPDFIRLRERALVRTVDQFAAGHADEDVPPDVGFVEYPGGYSKPPIRMLRMKALLFDVIVTRTREDRIPAPDLNRRGMFKYYHQPRLSEPLQLVRSILQQLKVDYSKPAPLELDRAPSIGYLMLEYLSGGTRSVVTDLEKAARQVTTQARLNARKISLDKTAEEFHIELTEDIKDDLLVAAACESAFLWTRHTGSYRPDEAWEQLWTGIDKEPYEVRIENRYRDFFATKSGFIGLGPATLDCGDAVIVPFGASRPLVVRKAREGPQYYLIGDAVIPGIMSGQLMNLHKEGSLGDSEYCFL